MRKLNKKQIIILIILTTVVTVSIILVVYLIKNQNTYTSEPIVQESLGTGRELSIDLENIEDEDVKDFKLWELSAKVEIENIENMALEIDSTLGLTDSEEGVYYYWSSADTDNYFQYTLLNNVLNFYIEDGIKWNEVELTGNSFSNFISKYFDKDWNYELTDTLNFTDGSVVFYAERKIYNDIPIETSELYNETDHLTLEDGRITSGRILLTTFTDTEQYLPVLKVNVLSDYIDLSEYPKSIYFNSAEIASVLSITDEYLNDEILKLQEEITDCRATSGKIVYLYKSFEQKYLTPVYRLDLECTADYEDDTYYISAVAFVSAVDPDYISASE